MGNTTAEASVIITAKNLASKTIIDTFNEAKRALDQTTNAQKQAASAAKEHSLSIVDLAAKLYLVQVGVRNVIETLKGIYEFGKLGATAEQVAISFANMTESVGSNAQLLDKLRIAARGTASDLELMQAAQVVLIGLTPKVGREFANALPHILEIARAANIANPALGTTAFLFESLTIGLKRLSPRLIDNTGLQLKLGQAQKDYAKSIGSTVENLTSEEKQLALLNATLEAGNRLIQQIGGSTESLTDPYTRLTATFKNLANAIAQEANPAITKLVEGLTSAAGALLTIIEWNEKVAEVLKTHRDEMVLSAKSYAEYAAELQRAAKDAGLFTDAQSRLFQLQEQGGRIIKVVIDEHYILSQIERERLVTIQAAIQEEDRRTQSIERGTDALGEMTEEEKKWAEQKEKTLDDLFMKELLSNEKLLEERGKLAQKSIEIDTDYQDGLTEIHEDAEQDRIDIAQRAGEERESIARRYNDRIADIDKSIAELRAEYENKNPFLSDATQQELTDVEQNAKSLQDTIKALRREQRLAPTDAHEQLISDYEARLQEVENHLSEIRNRAREEERKARIAFRIQELQDEKKALEEKRDQELAAINAQLQAKLAISIAKEEELTSAIEAEYIKRRIALNDQLNQIAEEADRKLKKAVVDAMLALVPAGSTAAQALMELKWKMHGATDEMIQDFYRTKASIDGQDGLVGGINRFAMAGFGTFFGMQGAVAGLNGQLMFTNFLLHQMASTTNYINNISGGGGGRYMYMQHGGPVSANRPYIVGEAGPELFVPQGGGNIVPNDRMGGGGANVSITINATAFQGSQADAIKFGNWVAPIVLQYMDRFGGNANAVGAKRIRSR